MRKSTNPHLKRIRQYFRYDHNSPDEGQFYEDLDRTLALSQHEDLYRLLAEIPDPGELLTAIHGAAYRPTITWQGEPCVVTPFTIGIKAAQAQTIPVALNAQDITTQLRALYQIPADTLIALDPHLYPAGHSDWENPSAVYQYLQRWSKSGFESPSLLFSITPTQDSLTVRGLNVALIAPVFQAISIEERFFHTPMKTVAELSLYLQDKFGARAISVNSFPLELQQMPSYNWHSQRYWQLQPQVGAAMDRLFVHPDNKPIFPTIHAYPELNTLQLVATISRDSHIYTLFEIKVPVHPTYDTQESVQDLLNDLLPGFTVYLHNNFRDCQLAAFSPTYAQ